MYDDVTTARFWSKVDKSGGPHACWPYSGPFNKGYGQFMIAYKNKRANRVALELHLGRELLDDEFALHECDNPPCCNPSGGHVYLGDAHQNMQDCLNRDRHPRSNRTLKTHCRYGHPLTDDNIVQTPGAGKRRCLTCYREKQPIYEKARQARRKEQRINKHG